MKKLLVFLGVVSLFFGGCSVSPQAGVDRAKEVAKATATAIKTAAVSPSKLDLSNKQLKKIPDDVFKQTKLTELDVSGNQLTGAIQSQIGQLVNLKVLDASNNQMTGVPAEIGQLYNLETLDLSNNQLTGLPNELGNLKKLKVLNISGNAYSTLDLDTIINRLPSGVTIIK